MNTPISSFLAQDATAHPTEDHLSAIRRLFGVHGPVPTSVRINVRTGQISDLDPEAFPEIVNQVGIPDLLAPVNFEELPHPEQLARRAVFGVIRRQVRAMDYASRAEFWEHQVGNRRLIAYNSVFTPRDDWDDASIDRLRHDAEDVGLFEIGHDPLTGIVPTSDTDRADMRRIWTTDGVMVGKMQHRVQPTGYRTALVTHSSLLCIPDSVSAALRALADPRWFRDPNPLNGVPHIFLQEPKDLDTQGIVFDPEAGVPVLSTVQRDPGWMNHKRLESQALLLESLVRALLLGSEQRAANQPITGLWWGELTAAQQERITTAIRVAALYLLAVEWNPDEQRFDFQAPTASSWEEEPIGGGCASDTGFALDAFYALRKLLFSVHVGSLPAMSEIRRAICNLSSVSDGELDAESLLRDRQYADFRRMDVLTAFIQAGQAQLDTMVINPILNTFRESGLGAVPEGVRQYLHRGADSSLALLAAYHRKLGRSDGDDVLVRLGIIRFLRTHLVPEDPNEVRGWWRYGLYQREINGTPTTLLDSYLNWQFELGLVAPGLVLPSFLQLLEHNTQQNGEVHNGALLRRRYWEETRDAYQRGERGKNSAQDATCAAMMALRQQFSDPERSAQWTIGPTAGLVAIAKAKKRLHLLPPTSYTAQIGEQLRHELSYLLNLVFCTIAADTDANGAKVLRADGSTLPTGLNFMEAFQPTPRIDLTQETIAGATFVPGYHTLNWSRAQAFRALELLGS